MEIEKAARTLKSRKSPVVDGITAKILKLTPDEVYETIADVLDKSVETDEKY